ncbi:MAG: hypothetical protein JRC86_10805 [Deltaproteobacteria bacterium]|nr:hypothetical protein [Deltaproteobacteria bacterium]
MEEEKDAMIEAINKLAAGGKVVFPTGASRGLLPQIVNDALHYSIRVQATVSPGPEVDGRKTRIVQDLQLRIR